MPKYLDGRSKALYVPKDEKFVSDMIAHEVHMPHSNSGFKKIARISEKQCPLKSKLIDKIIEDLNEKEKFVILHGHDGVLQEVQKSSGNAVEVISTGCFTTGDGEPLL